MMHGSDGCSGGDRSASSSSLRGASGRAPALKKVALAGNIVAAFLYAYTLAGLVFDQSNAQPFIIATQVTVARE